MTLKFHPDKELISTLYDEGKTVAELAEIFDCGHTTVRQWMDKFGLPRRYTRFTARNRVGERTWFPRPLKPGTRLPEPVFREGNVPPRYDLQELYITHRMSVWQIAEHYDRLESEVESWLSEYQLSRPLVNYTRPEPDDFMRLRACIVEIPLEVTTWGLRTTSRALLECGHLRTVEVRSNDRYLCRGCKEGS